MGGGAVISNASDELRAFAKKIQAPVADSLMGKGAYDGTDELYTGMVGMHGTKTSNFGITECDLLIVAGARFSDLSLIHICTGADWRVCKYYLRCDVRRECSG